VSAAAFGSLHCMSLELADFVEKVVDDLWEQ